MVRPVQRPQPIMKRIDATNPSVQCIHDAIFEADTASRAAAQAARNVHFLQAQATALVYRIDETSHEKTLELLLENLLRERRNRLMISTSTIRGKRST